MSKWEMVRLGDVCEVLDYMRVPITVSERKAGIYPYYGANGIQGYVDDYIFNDELVLLAEDGGNFGSKDKPIAYRVSGKCWVNNHAHVLKPKEMLDVDYLCYAIMFYDVMPLINGTTRAKLNQAAMRKMSIPLPPLPVQRKIADVLDRTDALIEKRKAQIKKLDLLIKSQFIEMFGDPVTNPKGWEKVFLRTVITHANNGMVRRGNDATGSIVLRLVELQNGYIDYTKPNRILLTEDEKMRYLLHDNDFLFARVNGNPDYVGRCAVFKNINEDVFHNDHIIRVRFDEDKFQGCFASSLLNSSYGKRQMRSQIKTSAGQYTISQYGIGAIEVVVPPLSLQNQFADFVQQVEAQKSLLQQSLAKLELNYKSLMQKCFRGEIF
jgi:type I restriction enzyme S subunit